MNYTVTSTGNDFTVHKIRQGERYFCSKTLYMDTNEVAFLSGKIYTSTADDHLKSEVNEYHLVTGDWLDAFSNDETDRGWDDPVYKDYFKSAAEEAMEQVGPPPNRGVIVRNSTEAGIIEVCNEIRDLLISKNRRYGNSALDPGVFGISPVVALKARIQDKLNRLKNDRGEDEDVILDLLGYFILLRIAIKGREKTI